LQVQTGTPALDQLSIALIRFGKFARMLVDRDLGRDQKPPAPFQHPVVVAFQMAVWRCVP